MYNIFIYGDSHAYYSLKDAPCYNFYEPSITMFRVGRDNNIIKFDNNIHNHQSTIVICYGEVDCRCHVKRQIDLGRDEDDIINALVTNYFNTIRNNVVVYNRVIVMGIIPTTRIENFEILHENKSKYPFVGSNEERKRFTDKMNKLIRQKCEEHGYVYFYPYDKYTDTEGYLQYELSDKCVHVEDNSNIITDFLNLLNQ